jgi:NAD(P)-dependent dehydrogenase (short-subunit alcohol dehydrogenase family)
MSQSYFEKKVVMVTGAAGNLGRAVADAFLASGATMVLLDRKLEYLQERYADLEASGQHLLAEVDLTDAGSIEGLVYETVKQCSRIDVLVNIAGGFRSGSPVHETPLETWDFLFNLNLKTAINTSRAVVPHMLRQGSGKIVNIGARAGLEGQANMAPYNASKSAVIRLTESMSAELKDQGINVNCVLPSTLDTPQNRQAMPKVDPDKWVTAEALADVILFLASDQARAIHGAAIPVYGRV